MNSFYVRYLKVQNIPGLHHLMISLGCKDIEIIKFKFMVDW